MDSHFDAQRDEYIEKLLATDPKEWSEEDKQLMETVAPNYLKEKTYQLDDLYDDNIMDDLF
jgi:hypothetical protein